MAAPDGLTLDSLTVSYDGGRTITPAATSEPGEYRFTMPAFDVTVTATFLGQPHTATMQSGLKHTVGDSERYPTATVDGSPVSVTDGSFTAHEGKTVALTVEDYYVYPEDIYSTDPPELYSVQELSVSYQTDAGTQTVDWDGQTGNTREAVDGQTESYANVYRFQMPAADVTVSGSYERAYEIKLDDAAAELVTVTRIGGLMPTDGGGLHAVAGREVELRLKEGAELPVRRSLRIYQTNSGEDVEISQTDGVYRFTMPGGSVTVGLIDDPIYYTLSGGKMTLSYTRSAGSEAFMSNLQKDSVTEVVFAEELYPVDTSYWFCGFSGLTTLTNPENLHTESVTNMCGMFYGCSSLETLDLSGFDTGALGKMDNMFYGCSKLETIYASASFTTDHVETNWDYNVFEGCESLVGGKGTAYDSNVTDRTYARIDGGTDAPGYFTDAADREQV